jgi:hypothetical protein
LMTARYAYSEGSTRSRRSKQQGDGLQLVKVGKNETTDRTG